jgi:hypothetical protein
MAKGEWPSLKLLPFFALNVMDGHLGLTQNRKKKKRSKQTRNFKQTKH